MAARSQIVDATKHVFPFARQHKAASDLTVALELLCIDAEVEWESIYKGRTPTRRSPKAGPGWQGCNWKPSIGIFRKGLPLAGC